MAIAWTWGSLLLVAAVSAAALGQWDSSFNSGARLRAAAVDAIPQGPFLAIDAAAWRWISGRSVLVTPSDGLAAATCVVAKSGARDPSYNEAEVSEAMKSPTIQIKVSLGLGKGRDRVLTCDLTKEYVAINGDYRS